MGQIRGMYRWRAQAIGQGREQGKRKDERAWKRRRGEQGKRREERAREEKRGESRGREERREHGRE